MKKLFEDFSLFNFRITTPEPMPLTLTHAVYDKLVADTLEKINKLTKLKGGEYAGDTDYLANFRRNSLALGLNMETVWAVYANKHWDAIQQYIKDTQAGVTRPRMETIDGRIDDLIVYLLLLKGILSEKDNGEKPNTADCRG